MSILFVCFSLCAVSSTALFSQLRVIGSTIHWAKWLYEKRDQNIHEPNHLILSFPCKITISYKASNPQSVTLLVGILSLPRPLRTKKRNTSRRRPTGGAARWLKGRSVQLRNAEWLLGGCRSSLPRILGSVVLPFSGSRTCRTSF